MKFLNPDMSSPQAAAPEGRPRHSDNSTLAGIGEGQEPRDRRLRQALPYLDRRRHQHQPPRQTPDASSSSAAGSASTVTPPATVRARFPCGSAATRSIRSPTRSSAATPASGSRTGTTTCSGYAAASLRPHQPDVGQCLAGPHRRRQHPADRVVGQARGRGARRIVHGDHVARGQGGSGGQVPRDRRDRPYVGRRRAHVVQRGDHGETGEHRGQRATPRQHPAAYRSPPAAELLTHGHPRTVGRPALTARRLSTGQSRSIRPASCTRIAIWTRFRCWSSPAPATRASSRWPRSCAWSGRSLRSSVRDRPQRRPRARARSTRPAGGAPPRGVPPPRPARAAGPAPSG